MAIVIPSKNIYSVSLNKIADNKITAVDVSLYDTNKVKETISFTWSGETPLLTNEFVERTAKIKEIKIRPDVEFYEVKEKYDENGFFEEYEYKPITSGFSYPSEYFKIDNPHVSGDPLDPYDYVVFKQGFSYSDGSDTTSYLTFGLTDNLRALAVVHEPTLTTGIKSFYVKSYSIVMKVEGVKKDFPETNKSYGQETDTRNRFSINGNELFQTTSRFGGENSYSPYGWSVERILTNYSNGRETAIVRCSISDYFDTVGVKMIDICKQKMTFDINDIVIPFVFGENGSDVPLSKKNGEARSFAVVGLKFIYDGAVWQELTLQEV